ncbi:hypothetical protein ACFLT5_02215 [Chloroflexota bacterium]
MGLAVWRDVSLMWLIFLTFVTILPIAVLFYYLIRGLHRLRQLTKIYMPIALEKTRLVADISEQLSFKVTDPIIRARGGAAHAQGISRAIFSRRKNA